MSSPPLLRIPDESKRKLHFLFLAKHALGDGSPDPEDGTHATYHHELRETLQGIGLRVTAANDFDVLMQPQGIDFVISLLNRAGFLNSEMLAPTLCERAGLPYLGAAPFVRGLGDDKHRMKHVARALGVSTPDWRFYPRGGLSLTDRRPAGAAWIVKPNASSASWGVRRHDDWWEVRRHVDELHRQGHDVIVESWVPGTDLALPVVGAESPWLLPAMAYQYGEAELRSYAQKRDLVAGHTEHVPIAHAGLLRTLHGAAAPLIEELWPFDYGRLEFRHDEASGRLWFIEVNLSCNLWSRKTVSAAARHIGVSHEGLIETIIGHSLRRQGLLDTAGELAA